MATDTVASVTDEQLVNKEKSEAIADMVASLPNEDAVKHDNLEDANRGHTTPSSESEGDETIREAGAIEVQKSDDSPAIGDSAEDNLKHNNIDDEVIPLAPLSKTKEDGANAEPAVVDVEKNDDTVSLETQIGDKVKEEKEVIHDSNATEDAAKSQLEEPSFIEPTVEETPQQLEKEPTEPKTVDDILEAPEAEFVKKAEIFETSDQQEQKPIIEPEPVATEVQEKTQELGKELAEVVKEADFLEASDKKEEKPVPKPKPEPVVVAIEVQDKSQEPEKESETEILKEAELFETSKVEPMVAEFEENPKEPENQSLQQKEEEQPNNVSIFEVPSAETGESVDEKTSEAEVLKGTNDYEAEPTETETAELVLTKVDENLSEQEKEPLKPKEEELLKTVIPETETSGDVMEVHPPKELGIEVLKEIHNSELDAVPGEVLKPDVVSAFHQPIVPDIEAVKETGTLELEVVLDKEETPEPVPIDVEEKPREFAVEAVENVGETTQTSKEVETKQEIVLGTTNNEEEKTDTIIKESISLKEEKTSVGDETSITANTANTAQVLVNEEAHAALENLVEPFIIGVSKNEADVLTIPEQASVNQEVKTGLIEETSFEEKAIVAENDDEKKPEAPEAVHVSSREAEVEINKDEKQIEVKTATTEDDGPAVKNEKREHIDTKVDEISSAVRETLASKFEEEETTKTKLDDLEKEQTKIQVPKEPTKDSDATKTSSKDLPKETPAKPIQKHSNNIISKVKQSLVKARKAIIGKSPSSKNHSTEAKDDIQVK